MKFSKSLSKRGLALFLVLAMCMSLLPTTALSLEAELDPNASEQHDSKLVCEIEEHTHDEQCYMNGKQELVCLLAEDSGHTHDEACYDPEGVLACGQEEHEAHIHGMDCYTAGEATLSCDKTEHTHIETCYAASAGGISIQSNTEPGDTDSAVTKTFIISTRILDYPGGNAIISEKYPMDLCYDYSYEFNGQTYTGTTTSEKLEFGVSDRQVLDVLVSGDGTPTQVTLTVKNNAIDGYKFRCQQFYWDSAWQLSWEESISFSVSNSSSAEKLFFYSYYDKLETEKPSEVTMRGTDILVGFQMQSSILTNDGDQYPLDLASANSNYSISYSYQTVDGQTAGGTLLAANATEVSIPNAYDPDILQPYWKWTIEVPVTEDGVDLALTQSNYNVDAGYDSVWVSSRGQTWGSDDGSDDGSHIGTLHISKDNNPVTPYICNRYVPQYTVTFVNEHTTVGTQKVKSGDAAAEINAPTDSRNYTFAGWFTAEGVPYDFNTPVSGDITLYAHWACLTGFGLAVVCEPYTRPNGQFSDNLGRAKAAGIDLDGITVPKMNVQDEFTEITISKNDTVTLLYEISVVGQPGAAYEVTVPEGVQRVGGAELKGTLTAEDAKHTGTVDSVYRCIYVTRTFAYKDACKYDGQNFAWYENTAGIVPGLFGNPPYDEWDGTRVFLKDPNVPNASDLELGLLVKCVNEKRTHTAPAYGTTSSGDEYVVEPIVGKLYSLSDKNGVSISNPQKNEDGTWNCTVTVQTDTFLKLFANDSNDHHMLLDSAKTEVSAALTLDEETGKWTVLSGDLSDDGNLLVECLCVPQTTQDVTLTVRCDDNNGHNLQWKAPKGISYDEFMDENNVLPSLETISSNLGTAQYPAEKYPYVCTYTMKQPANILNRYYFGLGDLAEKDPGVFGGYAFTKQFGHALNAEKTGFPQVTFYWNAANAEWVCADGAVDLYISEKKVAYTVEWMDKDTNAPLKSPETRKGSLDEVVYAADQDKVISGYTYDAEASSESIQLADAEEQKLTLYFKRNPSPIPSTYSITINVINGTSNPAGPVSVTAGNNTTISFTANEGYTLDSVTADGAAAVLTNGAYTFSNVNANHTISVVYVAVETPEPPTPTHTVTWVNWNGVQLSQLTNVPSGTDTPSSSYTGATPVRPSDATYNYTFSGWSAAVVDDNGNITYTAQYTPSLIVVTPDVPTTPVTPPTVPVTPTTPTPPTVTVPDTDVPLDDGTTTIDEPEVPLANAVGLNDVDHFAYVIGYDDDTVRPLNNITRAEVATIFFRLMTEDFRVANWATSNTFTDVKDGDWFNIAVSTCANAGILKGYEDGSFKPNNAITRAEFAAIAARFMDDSIVDDGKGDFSDTADHWAAADIRRAAKAGWVNGDGNEFRPNDRITRAEVMTIVNRMLDRTPDADHMLPTMKTWLDNPEGEWYYEAVQEATNEHAYERDESNVETWTEILTPRDWAAIETEWAANGGASASTTEPEIDPAAPVESETESGEGETNTDEVAD